MASLARKVVIITGASSGIGEGVARHFAKLGSKLSLLGRNAETLNSVATSCRQDVSSPTEVITHVGDIKNEADRVRLVDQTVGHFGKIDVLVNNAGTVRYNKVSDTSADDFDDMIDTNVKAHVFLTQLALPHLKKTQGNIVNTSSICGTQATPFVGVYSMSKAAMDMYTQCLALEMAPYGVRVNSINPAVINTNIHKRPGGIFTEEGTYEQYCEDQKSLHPMGRVGQSEDCAEAIAFLASDSASFITGQFIYVDGGRHRLSPGVRTDITEDT